MKELAPEGVDAALDLAGSGIIPELIEIGGDPSRVLSVADFSAEQYGAKFSLGPPKDPERVFADVARLCSEGLFRLRVDQTFPLERTAEAQEASANGRVTGKLVISISEMSSNKWLVAASTLRSIMPSIFQVSAQGSR